MKTVQKDEDELDDLTDVLNKTKYIDHYETNIHLTLARGIINNDVLNQIRCAYTNNDLLKKYKRLRRIDKGEQEKPAIYVGDHDVIDVSALVSETKSKNNKMNGVKGGFQLKAKHKSLRKKGSVRGGKRTIRRTRKFVNVPKLLISK
jgi:hypothetical protein